MNGGGECWTILQDRHLAKPLASEPSQAVKHSVGRGKFKDLAKSMTVPEIVLDKVIKSSHGQSQYATRFWTDEPRATGSRRNLPANVKVGGAGSSAGYRDRMRGIHAEAQHKPNISGRARTLNLRTKKLLEQQPRRPGCLVSKVFKCADHMGRVGLTKASMGTVYI